MTYTGSRGQFELKADRSEVIIRIQRRVPHSAQHDRLVKIQQNIISRYNLTNAVPEQIAPTSKVPPATILYLGTMTGPRSGRFADGQPTDFEKKPPWLFGFECCLRKVVVDILKSRSISQGIPISTLSSSMLTDSIRSSTNPRIFCRPALAPVIRVTSPYSFIWKKLVMHLLAQIWSGRHALAPRDRRVVRTHA